MIPARRQQIIWGFAMAAAAALVILVLAFVPDPLFRERVMVTTFDDVNAITPGTPVYFRGAEVGAVRAVDLDSATRLFAVRLGVRRDWHPSACSFAQIVASNPLTTPRIELVAVERPAAARCATARIVASCEVLATVGSARGEAIQGCRRAPDLLQSAAAAIAETTAVARTANQMATHLAAMLNTQGGTAASSLNMAKVVQDSTAALAALSGVAQRLDTSMDPKRGDIALTLANVRNLTGHASQIDVASINDTLRQVQTLVAQNQKSVAGILAEGNQTTAQARVMLEDLSASLTQTSANLARASDSAASLTERLAASPTYALHGQKFADPPPPETPK